MGAPLAQLRIGFVGAGFVARFHLQALVGVRHCTVAGVYSPTPARRQSFARMADELDLGSCEAFDSLDAMLASGTIDAIWLCNPNYTRLDAMRALHRARMDKRTSVFAIACEK